MIQSSILEQIIVFLNILVNNKALWILGTSALGLVLLLLLANKFHNKKITKILYTLTYLGIFGTLIYFFHTEILELFDYLINNIFLFLFFPNLAVYALVLVLVNVIIVKSTFSEIESKFVKILNIIFFIIFNIIFYLIIDNIIKNNVNVYEQLSIYTNNNLLVLVELSMKLFVIWILILGIIKVSRSLANSISLRKATNSNLALNNDTNELEIAELNTLSNVIEINPDLSPIKEIKEEVGKFNDYDDIVPMKKQMRKLTDTFRVKKFDESFITENNIQSLEEENNSNTLDKKLENITEIQPVNINDFNNQNTVVIDTEKEKTLEVNQFIPTIAELDKLEMNDNNNNNNNSTLTETINKVIPFENTMQSTLVLTDENNAKEEIPAEKPIITLSSYDYIFKNENIESEKNLDNNMEIVFNNNNLQNILFDIETLKDNQNDAEKIKKIYDNIESSQNELTLSDYNYLINKLLTIKK